MPESEFEYRMTYTLERREPGGDFAEIGFGASGTHSTIDDALYQVQSEVQNEQWETSDGMPDPADA